MTLCAQRVLDKLSVPHRGTRALDISACRKCQPKAFPPALTVTERTEHQGGEASLLPGVMVNSVAFIRGRGMLCQ